MNVAFKRMLSLCIEFKRMSIHIFTNVRIETQTDVIYFPFNEQTNNIQNEKGRLHFIVTIDKLRHTYI